VGVERQLAGIMEERVASTNEPAVTLGQKPMSSICIMLTTVNGRNGENVDIGRSQAAIANGVGRGEDLGVLVNAPCSAQCPPLAE